MIVDPATAIGRSTTRIRSPASRACASVSPTEATSGSVNTTCGTAAWSAVATCSPHGAVSTGPPAARAPIAAPTIRASYLPWWVSGARPVTSPAAYSHSPSTPCTSPVSSTVSGPGSRPTVSSPRSSTFGRRPVATSSSSTTRVSVADVQRDRVPVRRRRSRARCPAARPRRRARSAAATFSDAERLRGRQQPRPADQQHHLRTEPPPGLRQLAADDPAAQHAQPARHGVRGRGVAAASRCGRSPGRGSAGGRGGCRWRRRPRAGRGAPRHRPSTDVVPRRAAPGPGPPGSRRPRPTPPGSRRPSRG